MAQPGTLARASLPPRRSSSRSRSRRSARCRHRPRRDPSSTASCAPMLIRSDNRAANQLEVFFGGSTSGGSASVNSMMRALGLGDSEMYGGYETEEGTRQARAIPIRVESQPSISRTKYSTAWDLGRLVRYVHLARRRPGALVRRVGGLLAAPRRATFSTSSSHVVDRGKLDRFLPRLAVASAQGRVDHVDRSARQRHRLLAARSVRRHRHDLVVGRRRVVGRCAGRPGGPGGAGSIPGRPLAPIRGGPAARVPCLDDSICN